MGNRIFVYDGREFPDPDPNLKVDEVRQHMSSFFPELSNAQSKESQRGEDTIVEFKRRVGTKGKVLIRRKIISDVMDKDCICELWKFAQNELNLDIGTDEGVNILGLLALAWVTGAHQALAFPEMTSSLLADSDEVCQIVRDTFVSGLRDFPPDEIDNLVQQAMESERYRPVVSIIPKDFSFLIKN